MCEPINNPASYQRLSKAELTQRVAQKFHKNEFLLPPQKNKSLTRIDSSGYCTVDERIHVISAIYYDLTNDAELDERLISTKNI